MKLVRTAVFVLASGLGSGFSPRSPGTVGSLAAVAIWGALAGLSGAPRTCAWALAVFSTLVGLWASKEVLQHLAKREPSNDDSTSHNDPQFIVIDEWAGMALCLSALSEPTPVQVLAAFILFRLFDISKLGPVGWAESLPGAIGIMLDDLAAGVAGALVLLGWRALV